MVEEEWKKNELLFFRWVVKEGGRKRGWREGGGEGE